MKNQEVQETMKDLTEIMQLIDTHSDAMPEGDYLKLCGLMKSVFDDMSKKKAPSTQQVQLSSSLLERRSTNYRERARNRRELKEFTKEYRGLKIRSRITEGVRVDAGSDDREVCKTFLREKNLEVLRRRDELDRKFVELEKEWESLQETYWSIQVEQEDELAARIRGLGL
jgi:uncharacterized protein YjiS (DUF1127 family)